MIDDKAFRSNPMLERLQKDLRELEFEEERLKRELEENKAKQVAVVEEMKKFSNEKYEEDILALVYQQRHPNRK